MKYVVGAGIGGLFGLSVPFMLNAQEVNNGNDSRQEEFQPVEKVSPTPIDEALTLPDTYCGYIQYESTDPKEQAKECLNRPHVAIPAIQYVGNVALNPGDVIIDSSNGEIGLLLYRYDILEYAPMISPDFGTPDYAIWAWEILWTGPGSDASNRYQPYTESGLTNMIHSGTFEYIAAV